MSDSDSTVLPSVGGIVYIAIKPLVRLILPALAGGLLYRKGLLNPVGMRGIGQVILNVALPALLFSKIVQSISNDNLSELGIIILVAAFYQLSSAAAAVFMRAVLEIPSNFRHGFLAAAIFSNWGDLPTAVIQTITSSTPFGKPGQSDLAIAYVSIFILVYFVSFFPLHGYRLLQLDYTTPPPPATTSTRKFWRRLIYGYDGKDNFPQDQPAMDLSPEIFSGESTQVQTPADELDLELSPDSDTKKKVQSGTFELRQVNARLGDGIDAPQSSSNSQLPLRRPPHLRQDSTSFLHTTPTFSSATANISDQSNQSTPSQLASPPQNSSTFKKKTLPFILSFLSSFLTPPTISLLSALLIAFVPTLKGLFITLPKGNGEPLIKPGPDGLPPLSALLDFATFMGNASVPMGLIVLGASLASMQIQRPFSRLPIRSIVGLAVWKLVILPVLGVVLVRGLTNSGLVDKENTVLRFILMYFACVPTATTQIIFTQVYAPEGQESNSNIVAVYLIVQYIVLAFSSVVLTAVTLSMLF